MKTSLDHIHGVGKSCSFVESVFCPNSLLDSIKLGGKNNGRSRF